MPGTITSITISGEFPELPTVASFFSIPHQTAPYTVYDLLLEYEWDEGTIACPVAAAPGSGYGSRPAVEVIRVHAPFGRLAITGTCERIGQHPVTPKPFRVDGVREIKKYKVTNLNTKVDANGATPIYRRAIEIEYHLTRPIGVDDFAMLVPGDPTHVLVAEAADPADFDAAITG